MALSEKILTYLRLERLMIDLDDQGNLLADKMRDLMDPLWYSLSKEDHEFLDSRGEIDLRTLYPATLPMSDLYQNPSLKDFSPSEIIKPENGVGKRFDIKDAMPWAA